MSNITASLLNTNGSGSFQDFVLYVVTAAVAFTIAFVARRYQKLQDTLKHLPPAPEYGFIEYLTQLLGPQGPQFALQNARKLGYISRTPGMPSMVKNLTWVCVAEPTLARSILEDSQAQKPWEAYEFFDKALSGENFFTANGKRANHVRKSTAAAFSGQNMKKMDVVVDEVLDRWIQERLEPLYVQTGKAVDFDEEMMIVTTDVIARAGFDYELTPEERTDFTLKMRKLMDVFFHQNLDLGKKFFGFLYADIREARRSALELKQTFGYKLLEECRNNPNPSPGSIVHLMLNDDNYDNDDQRARDVLLYFFAGFEVSFYNMCMSRCL